MSETFAIDTTAVSISSSPPSHATVSVGVGTVYYSRQRTVSSTSNEGSLTVGQSATFTDGPRWLVSTGSGARVFVSYSPEANTDMATQAELDVTLAGKADLDEETGDLPESQLPVAVVNNVSVSGVIRESEMLPLKVDEFLIGPEGWQDSSTGAVSIASRSATAPGNEHSWSPVLLVETTKESDAPLLSSPPIYVDPGVTYSLELASLKVSGSIAAAVELIPFTTSEATVGETITLADEIDPGESLHKSDYSFGAETANPLPAGTARVVVVIKPTVGTVGVHELHWCKVCESNRLSGVLQAGGHEGAYDPATGVYLSAFDSGLLTKFGTDGRKVATLEEVQSVHHIEINGEHLYTVSFGGSPDIVAKIALSTFTIADTFDLPEEAAGYGCTSDGTYLYVAYQASDGDGHIVKVKQSDMTEVDDWEVGFQAEGTEATILLLDGLLWVHSAKDGRLFAVDPANGELQNFSNYDALIEADSPLAYYRLEEPSGTTMNDEQGVADGEYKNSVSLGQVGAIPGDLAPDFTSGYGDIDDTDLRNLSKFTVEAWVNPTTEVGGAQVGIFENKYGGSNVNYALGAGFTGAASNVGIGFYNGAWHTAKDPSATPKNKWTHYVGTYDGTKLTLYRNGAQIAQTEVTATPKADAGSHTFIGSFNGEFNWPGRIFRPALYSSALSAAQVLAHYTAGIHSSSIDAPDDYQTLANYGFGTDGTYLYNGFANGWLVQSDPSTFEIVDAFYVGDFVESEIKYDGSRYLWMGGSRELFRFDPQTGAILRLPLRRLTGGKYCVIVGREVWAGGRGDARFRCFPRSLG